MDPFETDPFEIGEFQFENLVRNRIPFVLVDLGADLAGLYPSFLQAHLESQRLTTTPESALADLVARAPAKDSAVVVISQDGETSGPVARRLIEQGYQNVYSVLGGANSLRPPSSR